MAKNTNEPHNSYQQFCILEDNGARPFKFWGKSIFYVELKDWQIVNNIYVTKKPLLIQNWEIYFWHILS